MCEAHVRVLHEIRSVLKGLQPTLKNLRGMQPSRVTTSRGDPRRRRNGCSADVERLIEMCEEVSDLLWVKGTDIATGQS